jgi:hypothetical protein
MLTEAHVAMKEKLTSLEAIASTKSSHVIGKTGEATVLELLESGVIARFEHSELKDMTSVGHAADFHVWVVNAEGKRVKILVDSKKYKRAVSSEEIAKLAEDVDADVEASAGILISLDSGICTKKQFQISRTPKQKPILYLIVQDTTVDQQRDMISWSVLDVLEKKRRGSCPVCRLLQCFQRLGWMRVILDPWRPSPPIRPRWLKKNA